MDKRSLSSNRDIRGKKRAVLSEERNVGEEVRLLSFFFEIQGIFRTYGGYFNYSITRVEH
ncbi:hypothetical protein [Paenibacillus sp.]|jgi:hypothetical protein|uniref:hypothetical protein n=1 Tax=Paenibacillus sp. TaxID=58172 RepID=UPI002832DC03|nr:hypothetical protein [Paenibacillus sp.]MDR0269997.1 hypothetical protein [Paenibacillus sp.]